MKVYCRLLTLMFFLRVSFFLLNTPFYSLQNRRTYQRHAVSMSLHAINCDSICAPYKTMVVDPALDH